MLRIENKTYGVCRVTGKLIQKERLKLVPHATLSIEAKKKQSRLKQLRQNNFFIGNDKKLFFINSDHFEKSNSLLFLPFWQLIKLVRYGLKPT